MAEADAFVAEKNTAASELDRAKRIILKLNDRSVDRGFTEEEAMEAAEKIGELLEQFDLRLTDVIVREERCLQRKVFAADRAMGTVISGLGGLCSLICYCESNSTPVTYVLFGMERDIELAVYLYEICAEAADEGWADFIRSGRGWTVKQRESFRMGFASRLFERFMRMKQERDQHRMERNAANPTGTDLVLVREAIVDEEFAKTGVRLVKGRSRRISDYSAYRQGHAAADEVNLNSPIEGGAGPAGHLS